MFKADMIEVLKKRLVTFPFDIVDIEYAISDAITIACNYCNIGLDEIPEGMEPWLFNKSAKMLSMRNTGGAYTPPVSSIREGDMAITYSEGLEDVNMLTKMDRKNLNRFRRLRRSDESI